MNITKRSIIFVFLLLPLQLLLAQPEITVDTTSYLDSELYEEEIEVVYSWLGGGFYVGYFKPDLTNFNKNIARPFVAKDVDEQVLFFGGRGFIPFPYLRNLRIGGAGYGGSSEECCKDTVASTGQNVTRSLSYSIGYGALTIDYALPIAVRRMHFLIGTELGLGGIDIKAKQAAKRTKFDIVDEFTNSTNITHTYSSSLLLIKPQVQIEWAPTNFLMFQLAGGYQITSMGDWKADGDVDLGNTDALNNIDGSGLVLNLGINIGFFQ